MTVNYYHCNSLRINELFADAETGEDGGKEEIGGNGAGDGAQVGDGLAQGLGDEVGGEGGAEAVEDAADAGEG